MHNGTFSLLQGLILSAAFQLSAAPADALRSITTNDLLRHVQVLASDEFEGRAPGSAGEKLTVQYLEEQFKRIGLKPGNPNGTYTQPVPLVGITSITGASLQVKSTEERLRFPEDYVAWSPLTNPLVQVETSPLVFVGYGVVAPEYGWDDYKGVDVSGKTLVMLVNDPPVPDPADPARLDERTFKGKAMTYYGRWTYKYEIAAQKGAVAAIIVHETGPAGYPYAVVISSWGRENFALDLPDPNAKAIRVASWMSLDKATQLFAALGHDFARLKELAQTRAFAPVSLPGSISFAVTNSVRCVESRNVLGLWPGTDPRLRSEIIIYSAHWDHLGRDTALSGDQIYNGALDNASGTGGILELAEAFTHAEPQPRRSVLFLSVTAEEQGLLGAKFYAAKPLYPLHKTVANINLDGVNQWGRTRDVVTVGTGQSTLENIITAAAEKAGRIVVPDPEPEKGYYYRSDHFEFAKRGVPALYLHRGSEYIDKPEGYGERKRREYVEQDYHKPSDEIKPDWDLAGAIEDLRLLFSVGYEVAQSDRIPEWKESSEFKRIREESLRR